VQIREALDVEHVNFVDKQDAGDQLGNALVDVLVHDLVDLFPQLVCTTGYTLYNSGLRGTGH